MKPKWVKKGVPRKIIKNVTFGTLLGAILGAILVTFGTIVESMFDVLFYFLGFFGTVVSRVAWIMLARTFRICVCTCVHLLGNVVFICVHLLGIWLTPLARCLAYVRKVLVVVSVQFSVDFFMGSVPNILHVLSNRELREKVSGIVSELSRGSPILWQVLGRRSKA